MNKVQIWQTIALDLKRAANLLSENRKRQAEYFLDEAKRLYQTLDKKEVEQMTKGYLLFDGHPEDILLGSTLISARI